MIGRKQSSRNEDWLRASEEIETLVSREELDRKAGQVIDDIRRETEGKRTAYAWSGGKDSIVLSKLCEDAGIRSCLFVHTDLEYPAFLSWCMEHKPDGCTVINTHQDLDWLAKHPEMLFPQSSKLVYRWFQSVQQRGIREYFRDKKLDLILVGHRKADGNYTGNNCISSNRRGVTRYAPLADWTHEDILAAIHYWELPMPPIYNWKDGYRNGTHSWPCRVSAPDTENGYREVYEIDPDVVIEAAQKLDSARAFLEGVSA